MRLRMICNAAGGLLPSLAIDIRDRFQGAVVLPSYGMTEYVSFFIREMLSGR